MIMMKKEDTGIMKECTTGYSWTSFFFGLFVPLLRGDIKWAAILFLVTCLVSTFSWMFAFIPNLFVGPVFAFFYNKLFIKDLMEKGYVPADEASKDWLIKNGIVSYRN